MRISDAKHSAPLGRDVLLVVSDPFPHTGGVSTHIQGLLNGLKGHRPSVLSTAVAESVQAPAMPGVRMAWTKRLRSAICRVRWRSPLLSRAMGLIPALAASDAAIWHCHDAISAFLACYVRKRHRKPTTIVATVHGPCSRHMREVRGEHTEWAIRAVESMERTAWREVDQVIAVDRGQAEIAIRQGASRSKVVVVRNAVDVEQISSVAGIAESGTAEDAWRIVVPRRLVPKNGVGIALQALAKIQDQRPRLLICGDGPLRGALVAEAEALGIAERVEFRGCLPHDLLLREVRRAAIVVVPSLPVAGVVEATSMAMLEAMGLGKPVVASRVGGLEEIVGRSGTARLVSPGDPSELALSMWGLLESEDARRTLGALARRHILVNHRYDDWVRAMEVVYRCAEARRLGRAALLSCPGRGRLR